MSAPPVNSPPASLADTLGPVHVAVREDLEVTRHVFRGEVSYVIRDPMTFQSHRLTLPDYEVFVQIRADVPLSSILQSLIEAHRLTLEQNEVFYRFVLHLHRLGFLRLPIADSKALYDRFKMRGKQRRREKTLGFLFLRIPLWNPDQFLSRTIRYARPLFTHWAFTLWLLLMTAALYVAVQRRGDLAEPLQGVLVAGNLPLLAATLIVLKIIHEFGHAYACKSFGGHVPEMGAYLIMFTPCAYVDATACWGFTRRWHRIVVCAAGMYVESIFAAVAVLVWAATGPSLLQSVAYNIIFLAGAVTVLFNINPLVRYDGYHILSDLVDVPNLRQRSTAYLRLLLKRLVLGVRTAVEPQGRRLHCLLFSFAAAAGLYRAALILAIAGILAAKLGMLGLIIGVISVGATLAVLTRNLLKYLLRSEETIPVRGRALLVAALIFVALPAGIFFMPVSGDVVSAGVLSAEREVVLRAPIAGTIEMVQGQPGEHTLPDRPLFQLTSDRPLERILEARAGIESASIRADAFRPTDPAKMDQEQAKLVAAQQALNHARHEEARLVVAATVAGTIVESVDRADVGRHVAVGEPLAKVVSGQWRVRSILSEADITKASFRVGDCVQFRAAADPARPMAATVLSIAPAGTRIITVQALTQGGTGDVLVEEQTNTAQQPYFEVTLGVNDPWPLIRYGMTGYARFPAEVEPLGKAVGRSILRFWARLLKS